MKAVAARATPGRDGNTACTVAKATMSRTAPKVTDSSLSGSRRPSKSRKTGVASA